MSIHYSLKDNHLTTDPNDYYPQVQITASADIDAVAARMVEMGSTVGLADIRAVLTELDKVCQSLVLDGQRVNLGDLVDIYPRMTGTFHGASDVYDPARHQVGASASVSSRFLKAIRAQASVQKNEPSIPMPDPFEFVEADDGVTNTNYSPNGIGTLNGARLQFDPEAADEGIYFIAVSGGAETKVITVAKNKPSQLMFLVPPTLTGDQYVEVRARIDGGQQLRTGRLPHELHEV